MEVSFANGQPSPLQTRDETGPRHGGREAQHGSAPENAFLDLQASSDTKTLKGVKFKMQYAIVIETAPGSNYSAYVPDLPGCIAAADTLEETKRLMQEAIAIHIAGMREDGLPIPAPSTEVAVVEVAA
jgi:predicted RNase H-like HicB family nuclease